MLPMHGVRGFDALLCLPLDLLRRPTCDGPGMVLSAIMPRHYHCHYARSGHRAGALYALLHLICHCKASRPHLSLLVMRLANVVLSMPRVRVCSSAHDCHRPRMILWPRKVPVIDVRNNAFSVATANLLPTFFAFGVERACVFHRQRAQACTTSLPVTISTGSDILS